MERDLTPFLPSLFCLPQVEKDIDNKNRELADPHWHFEHDPRVAPEMKPILDRMDSGGIPWTWGGSTPNI